MASVEVDFYSDWIALIRRELASVGYPVPGSADQQEVCFRYFNYRKRAIDVRPRNVLESTEFTIPQSFDAAYAALKARMEGGADLRSHLSRRLIDPGYDDPMLNDWGIHHFHLGTTPERDGFVTRTNMLLYARVSNDRILCLQILPHANWANRRLIEIWNTNWPETLDRYRLRGFSAAVPQFTDSQVQFTDSQLQSLRQGHVFTVLTLSDGSTVAPPGGGVASSGLSAQVVADCDWYARTMRQLEQHVQQRMDDIVTAAKSNGVDLPESCVFRLHVHNGSFVAVEESTNWGFLLFTPK